MLILHPTRNRTGTRWNHGVLSFSSCRRRRVPVDFSVGSISSDGGALQLREVDRKLGLTVRAHATMAGVDRSPMLHRMAPMCIRQPPPLYRRNMTRGPVNSRVVVGASPKRCMDLKCRPEPVTTLRSARGRCPSFARRGGARADTASGRRLMAAPRPSPAPDFTSRCHRARPCPWPSRRATHRQRTGR